jgi:dihydrofolate reductase
MWNMVTLDGFFEGTKPWEIDWHSWGDDLEQLSRDQLESADMLLFGRVTYQGMASYWPTETGDVAELMNTIPKAVFSKTLDSADWSNTRLINTDAEAEIKRMKQEPGKELFIFGSANLCSTLQQQGLIDEYRLGVNPILLGNGNPLFKPMPNKTALKLLEARTLTSGCVLLRYEPIT